jgi:hypothetical protein
MNWCPTIGLKLAELGRVTEAEFEVTEPTTSNDEQRDKSAGDGNPDHGGQEWSCIATDRTGRATDIYYP